MSMATNVVKCPDPLVDHLEAVDANRVRDARFFPGVRRGSTPRASHTRKHNATEYSQSSMVKMGAPPLRVPEPAAS
ncbi:hypothetical protein HBI31_235400 [Parastagonospora nodorum]|nr:hypothetical protein HBI31_235400 [Parastagonospora nodorum]